MAKILQPEKVVRYRTRHNDWSRWHVVGHTDTYQDGTDTYWTGCNRFYEAMTGRVEAADFSSPDVRSSNMCENCLGVFKVVDE